MQFKRLKKLQSKLKHPILVKKKENLHYLIGSSFEHAEGYLLVTKTRAVFFGSGLEKIAGIKKVDRLKNIATYLGRSKRLDIEYAFMYGEGEYLQEKLPGVKIHPIPSPVSLQRQIKEPAEIALVSKSMQIVSRVFWEVRRQLTKKTWTERALAEFVVRRGKSMGAEAVSFPAIVASGRNAAVPHHVPGNKKLAAGESIILDFGFKYKGYCSDFTRTVFLKKVPEQLAKAYRQVEKAYQHSYTLASQPFVTAGRLYDESVQVLAEKRLDKHFIHSLGHGSGLEIHELPNLSPKSKDKIQDGMVFSIEPGVYFPKSGGIRIEDLVYMEDGVCKKFIDIPTNLPANIL